MAQVYLLYRRRGYWMGKLQLHWSETGKDPCVGHHLAICVYNWWCTPLSTWCGEMIRCVFIIYQIMIFESVYLHLNRFSILKKKKKNNLVDLKTRRKLYQSKKSIYYRKWPLLRVYITLNPSTLLTTGQLYIQYQVQRTRARKLWSANNMLRNPPSILSNLIAKFGDWAIYQTPNFFNLNMKWLQKDFTSSSHPLIC